MEKSSTTRTIDLRGDYYWYNEEKISLAPVLATTLSSTEDSEVVFYRNPEGNQIGVTNKFGVVLKSEKDVVKLEQLAADNGIFLLGKDDVLKEWYYLVCTENSTGNALEMANMFYETGLFEDVAPDLLVGISPTAGNPSYLSQEALHNTASNGVDINYHEAVTSFSFPNMNNVVVAVIDDGIDISHSDLPALYRSYDAHTGRSPAIMYGDHGTQVSGIIAARHNEQHIDGIAPGVKLISVSIKYTASSGGSQTSSANIARGIRWAVDNGAKIINCSWKTSPNNDITREINYALGANCVVVSAAGNDNGPVSYPANLSGVIAVGAVMSTGQKTSDGNYGIDLSVVAPGFLIKTTFPGGITGFSSATSIASPHVSGIAALLFSVYPNLTRQQVVNAIIKSGSLYPSRNNTLGYGVVDAFEALIAPLSEVFQAPATIDCVNTTVTLPALPTFVTNITWRGSAGVEIVGGQGSQTVTFRKKAGSSETNSVLYADLRLSNGQVVTRSSTGMSSASASVSSITVEGSGRQYSLTVNPYAPVSQYEWRVSPSSGVQFGSSTGPGAPGYNYISFSSSGSYRVEARVNNRCGAGSWTGTTISVY